MRYRALCRVALAHDFYASGLCGALSLEPTPEGARLLRNQRLRLTARPGVVTILAQQDAQGSAPMIPLDPSLVLPFRLRVDDRGFTRFTDLTAVRALAGAPRYSNVGLAADARALELSVAPPRSRALAERGADTFAEVELTGFTAAWQAEPPEFTIRFSALQTRWVYYLVTDIDPSRGALALVDVDKGQGVTPLVFSEAGPADPRDELAAELAARYPGARTVRFVSDALVPSRALPRRCLEIHLDGAPLMRALPNPSLGNDSTVEVTVDAKQQRQPSLFQVVKHLTHSLAQIG